MPPVPGRGAPEIGPANGAAASFAAFDTYCVMWRGMILQHQPSDRVKSERDSRPASPRRRTGLRVLPSPGQSHDAGCSP